MEDVAAFKFTSLPGVTFVATRVAVPGAKGFTEGFITYRSHLDGKGLSECGGSGPVGPQDPDRPFVPGGKVPFAFRSLPGVTFFAARQERDVILEDSIYGPMQVAEGWVRITYYVDGNDEEIECGGFAGPRGAELAT